MSEIKYALIEIPVWASMMSSALTEKKARIQPISINHGEKLSFDFQTDPFTLVSQ